MRAIPLTLLFLFTIALYACGANKAASEDKTDEIIDEAPAIVAAEKSPDQRFIDRIAANDKFAIDEAQIVLERSIAPQTRAAAQQMIAAHKESMARLTAITEKLSMQIGPLVPPPSAHKKAVDSLRSLNMEQFDARYAVDQINAHHDSLEALNAYARNGSSTALREYARQQIPTFSGHLDMVEKIGDRDKVHDELIRQKTAP